MSKVLKKMVQTLESEASDLWENLTESRTPPEITFSEAKQITKLFTLIYKLRGN